jgi:small subunit ribosomal protein S11
MAKTAGKKRKVVVESIGEAHINATFNNIIISLTNTKGEVISWSSAGKMGFRGSKKIHLMLLKLPLKMLQKWLKKQV